MRGRDAANEESRSACRRVYLHCSLRAEPEMGFLWKYLLFRAALLCAKIMLTTSTCSELIISLANLVSCSKKFDMLELNFALDLNLQKKSTN
jgi:hypothetical protein